MILESEKFKSVVSLLVDWRDKNPGAELRVGLAEIMLREKILG